jgi:predicted amidohydrolase
LIQSTFVLQNGAWVLYANHAGVEKNARYLSNCSIEDPDGTDAIRAGKKQQLIIAEISLDALTRAQKRLP